jgi:hypothetical protein
MALRGSRGITGLSLALVLDGGGCKMPCPSSFTTGKRPVPIVQEGGLQGQSGQVQKVSHPLGFNPRTVQPIAHHCTAYAISVHGEYMTRRKYDLLITEKIHLINLKVKHLF